MKRVWRVKAWRFMVYVLILFALITGVIQAGFSGKLWDLVRTDAQQSSYQRHDYHYPTSW